MYHSFYIHSSVDRHLGCFHVLAMDMVGGEEGEGEMYGESNMEIYNIVCKIDSQQAFAVWLRELKQGLCDGLQHRMGRGTGERSGREGTWVCLWLILVDIWQKTTKFCKAIILQLKKNFFKLIVILPKACCRSLPYKQYVEGAASYLLCTIVPFNFYQSEMWRLASHCSSGLHSPSNQGQ